MMKKSIFSSPMAATPAAEPIIRIEPLVPAMKRTSEVYPDAFNLSLLPAILRYSMKYQMLY